MPVTSTTTRARGTYQRLPQGLEGSPHVGSLDVDDGDLDDGTLLSDGRSDAEDDDDRGPGGASDDDGDNGRDDDGDLKKQRRSRAQRAAAWSTKMHAFLWVVAAAAVAYAIDFFHVIFHDPRVRSGYFHLGLVCMGINTVITCYLAIYLPYIKRIHLEWNVYCPRMIPTATIVGIVATLCFLIALWPIWGLLTPGLLLLFFIGSLMTAHFLPAI